MRGCRLIRALRALYLARLIKRGVAPLIRALYLARLIKNRGVVPLIRALRALYLARLIKDRGVVSLILVVRVEMQRKGLSTTAIPARQWAN